MNPIPRTVTVLVDYSNGYWTVTGLNDFGFGGTHGRRYHMRELRRMRGQVSAELSKRYDQWECRVVYTPHAYRVPNRIGVQRVTDFGPKQVKK